MAQILNNLAEMHAAARTSIALLKPKDTAVIVALYGDLGAGKTSFVQGAAAALGIEESIISPTYVIEKIYRLLPGSAWQRFVHIDAYRLEGDHDLAVLGWDEIAADPKNIIFLEWAEKVEVLLPSDTVKIFLSHTAEGAREISIMNL